MGIPGSKANTNLFTEDDLLASTVGVKPITVTIATEARDAGHPDGSTNLRKGLVLGKITASGKYAQFNSAAGDGTEVSSDAVILRYDVTGIDEGDQKAAAFFAAMVKESRIFVASGNFPTWADVQRLEIAEGQ